MTDRHISYNKPDIVIKEKETDMCLIIDVTISVNTTSRRRSLR